MRLGVLDVGSQSAHLDVLSLRSRSRVHALATIKQPTRLAEAIGTDGAIGPEGMDRLVGAVRGTVRMARDARVGKLIAFGTSAVRDAANRDEAVERIAEACGVRLGFFSGPDEARLTFLAARAWCGGSAGPLLLADIGGGSIELAAGAGPEADWVLSLPLGARALTHEALPGDPPRHKHVEQLRRHVARDLSGYLADGAQPPNDALPIATSKTFLQLAKLTRGRDADGHRTVSRRALHKHIPRLATMRVSERAGLKGVTDGRARQILAGAIVAEAVMDAFGISTVKVCPWALREGIALRWQERLNRLERPGDELDRLLMAPER